MDNVNHWSYSSSKDIYRKGVDYAVAAKLGIIEKTFGKATDIGKFVHAVLLGGAQEFVVNPYKDFRTKEAREWRDSQTLTILSEEEFEKIVIISERIKSHPLAYELLCGKGVENEVKLTVKIDGREWVGYADALKKNTKGDVEYVADLKTTAQFDEFKYTVNRNDYDLQCAIYHLMSKSSNKPFYWIMAETIPPYRVGIGVASQEFEEKGYGKLQVICDKLVEFENRDGKNDREKLNFNQNETMDDLLLIGDWSV